ncbi:MAG: hypothetical protein GTN75_00690 [Gemmatimonadetes bacterium]|nr:hypothetical protein [Gemmatimonadota bacterium]
MTKTKKTGVLATLLLLGAVACADLDVVNPNDADAARVFVTAGDIEALIGGAFRNWQLSTQEYGGPSWFLSAQSFQHSSCWANAAVRKYGWLPRPEIINSTADGDYGRINYVWSRNYRAIAAVADGLRAIEDDPEVAAELGATAVNRANAYGKFVQGLTHGSIGLLYDRGFIVDETTDISQPQEAVDYNAMLAAALDYFDQAIALATGQTWVTPDNWLSVEVSADELIRLAHSMKARYMAAVARTPTERAAVNWNTVITEIDAGITEPFIMDEPADYSGLFYNDMTYIFGWDTGWIQIAYFILGMADQSGNYQHWLSISPVMERVPSISMGGTRDIMIVTPDLRFPQGTTPAEQDAYCPYDADAQTYCVSRNLQYAIPYWSLANVWKRPDRGKWRWSWYVPVYWWNKIHGEDLGWYAEMTMEEMNLLKAEALYRTGDPGGAATIINITREAAGLNATDAASTNTSCVPKLPDGTCGDLFEMLKWEKRIHTQGLGLHSAPWYFEGRGWGDLYIGTQLQFPIPCQELETLQMLPCYTFGSTGGEMAAPRSVYNWPLEE